jgi:nucleotide-binding universal stress UspA family protein
VVVGVDEAPETELAVEFAVAAADCRRVPLVAVTGVPPVWPALSSAFPIESGSTAEVVMTMLRELQDVRLGPALARHPSVTVEHRAMAMGAAAPALIDASSAGGLLVVGAGRSALLGSVGSHVVRHAACPVAVVPGHPDR